MIKDNLSRIYDELPSGVQLVAVSKFHPVERLMEAYEAGQRVFGENRPQEFASKVHAMPADTRWHFIGHLQTNKLKLVLPYAELLQSVDSIGLLEAVDRWCRDRGRVIDVLLEIHLGAEESKHGLSADEARAILRGDYPGVRFRGLMAMATNTSDEAVLSAEFSRIQALFESLKAEFPSLDAFDQLSIGMSGDWRIAVRYGATIVRIGTDIFGPREY